MATVDLLGRAAQGPLSIANLPADVENVRIELIDGSLFVTPLGDLDHQRLIMDYAFLIKPHVPEGLHILAGVNVIVGEQTLIEPDLAVVDLTFAAHGGLGVSPVGLLFALEISSPSTRRRDLTLQRDLYREWEVPHLIVDRSTTPFTMLTDGDLPPYTEVLLNSPAWVTTPRPMIVIMPSRPTVPHPARRRRRRVPSKPQRPAGRGHAHRVPERGRPRGLATFGLVGLAFAVIGAHLRRAGSNPSHVAEPAV